MSAKTDKCSDNNKSVCDYNDFSRLRFFHGMLLDDKDFRVEQQYHANKRRFLNRMLHGSGVVCGLELHGEREKRSLTVTRGLALDCSGNEIWVPQDIPVDICSLLPPPKKGKGGPCDKTDDGKPKSYYIGIRYQEKETNPVSVYLPSGSCEERTCENSRIKEGYCVEIVDCCVREEKKDGVLKGLCDCENGKAPGESKQICRDCGLLKNTNPGNQPDPDQTKGWCQCVVIEDFCERSPACAECCCCDDPCFVVLGRIELDDQCGLVSVCNNECRKYVLTPHLLRHMLIGVFNGFEQNVTFTVNGQSVEPPTATTIADNPIKALCWVLDNLVVNKGDVNIINCGQREEKPPPPKDVAGVIEQVSLLNKEFPVRIAELQGHLDSLNAQLARVVGDINDIRVGHDKRLLTLEGQPPDKKAKK